MLDIDVNHWRNLQALLLDSAKERRRIIVIHEDGEVLKLVHTQREPIRGSVERVDDPHAVAERLYRENAANVDFVAIFERRAFDEYFGRFQGTWRADEDLDEFVHRTYKLIDEYPDGLVTHPGPARQMLGLQWRLGADYEQVKEAVKRFVPPNSTVVFGIFEGDRLWATLVLGFDAYLRANVVTTVDTSRLTVQQGREETAEEVVSWVNGRYAPCSIGLFTSLEGARAFLETEEKMSALRALADKGDLIASPVPEALPLASLAAAR
ncbi:MAG: hypothetical protein ACXVY8_08400 [Gaiellaceae bacterium]